MPTPNFTAGDVMNSSAALLNDSALSVYTYAVQLPYVKMAMRELREYLELNNVPVTNVSQTVLTVPAGTTEISFITTPALPDDLVEIRQLWERLTNVDPFVPMVKRDFLPHYIDGVSYTQFQIYSNNNNAIQLPSSVQINDLKLDYIRQIGNVVDQNSQLEIINGQAFLEYRTAALCARYIMENDERAKDLDENATNSLDRLEGISVKSRQSIATRHRPFRNNWKRRGY